MTNPKLALIPSGYQGGTNPTVYSILPSDGSGDFDFDRASEGTRVRKDGLIEEVADDVPRLDWSDGNCPSLLLEPQSRNLVTYSEDFSQSDWSKTNATITSNAAISPDGTTNADKIVGTTVTSQHRVNFTSTNVSGATTFSFFAKSGEYSSCWARISFSTAYFDLENGVSIQESGITSSIENYGNGWYRCIMTKASSSANEVCRINITTSYGDGSDFLGDNTSGIYIWGAQAEEGYPTSYIKTQGEVGGVTRLADECNNAGNADLFDITEGTFFVDVTPNKASTDNRIQLGTDDGNNLRMVFLANNTQVQLYVQKAYVPQAVRLETITFNSKNKIAITFKENDIKFFVNGFLVHTDNTASIPLINKLNFSNNASSQNFEGKVHDTRVYDRVLTEAEAIELTTL